MTSSHQSAGNSDRFANMARTSHFIVGIAGLAGHGKDTLASVISETLHPTTSHGVLSRSMVATHRMADAIKDAYAVLFSIDRPLLEELSFKLQINPVTGKTHREELQFLGTEAYRDRTGNKDIWIHTLCSRLSQWYGNATFPVLIPDIRYDNEAKFCKDNGLLIQIFRPDQEKTANSSHPSEAGISVPPDAVIVNGGSLDDLKAEAVRLAGSIHSMYEAYLNNIAAAKRPNLRKY